MRTVPVRFRTTAICASILLTWTAVLYTQAQAPSGKSGQDSASPPGKSGIAKDGSSTKLPKNVVDKLKAARKAVAEAIAEAESAGLIETTLDTDVDGGKGIPPILDFLIDGKVDDVTQIKNHSGVSPEVFGAWFTEHGKLDSYVAAKDIRIMKPEHGLADYYCRRREAFKGFLEEARKSKNPASPALDGKKS